MKSSSKFTRVSSFTRSPSSKIVTRAESVPSSGSVVGPATETEKPKKKSSFLKNFLTPK